MFKRLINGKWCLVNAKGAVVKNAAGAEIEVSAEDAAAMQELKEGETAPELDDEAVKSLKTWMSCELESQLKGLDVKGTFGTEVSKALGQAFKKETTTGVKFLNGDGTKEVGDGAKVKELVSAVKGHQNKSFEFSVKTLSELSSLTGEVIPADVSDTEIIREPIAAPIIESLASVSNTTFDKVSWVEKTGASGAAATTAELAKFPNKDYTFTRFSTDVRKVAVSTKQSNEILEDMSELATAVKEMLTDEFNLTVDALMYSDTGATGHFTGVYTQAPAFDAAGVTVPNATIIDLLRLAVLQVRKAGKGKFRPNAIMLNPIDCAKLDLQKDANGQYVLPPFMDADRTKVKGTPIVECDTVSENTFLVGDLKKLRVRNRRGFSVQVATENEDDFLKDLITLRVTRRLAFFVKTNENGAFVKCADIADAVSDITPA